MIGLGMPSHGAPPRALGYATVAATGVALVAMLGYALARRPVARAVAEDNEDGDEDGAMR